MFRGRRVWAVPGLVLLVLAVVAGAILAVQRASHPSGIEEQARRFVSLGLLYSLTDEKALDVYFGPQELKPAADTPAPSLDTLRADLAELKTDIENGPQSVRAERLDARIASLLALIGTSAEPGRLSFDEETSRVYGITVPELDEDMLRRTRDELEALLPGPGSLTERVAAFERAFVVPTDRRRDVFMQALAECKERTARHWPFPADDELDIEWTGDVDAAWHRYQGSDRSILQVNPQAVAFVGSALDIACHEAYPGHHAQFLAMSDGRDLPVEETLVFVQSPGQLLREGAAEYGVGLTFSLTERVAFLRDSLFSLAGFDPSSAAKYAKVHQLTGRLAAATTPIFRDYRDGRKTFYDAASALEKEALIVSPRALLQFVDENRSYVLGYSVARELVRRCIDARSAGKGDGVDAQWRALRAIVSTTDVSALKGEGCPA